MRAGEIGGKGGGAASNARVVVSNSREKIRENLKKKVRAAAVADGRTSARRTLPRTAADNRRPRQWRRTAVWALGFSSNPSSAPGGTQRRRRIRDGRWCSDDDNDNNNNNNYTYQQTNTRKFGSSRVFVNFIIIIFYYHYIKNSLRRRPRHVWKWQFG